MCGQKWEGKFSTHIFLFCTLYNVLPSEMTNITDEKSMQRLNDAARKSKEPLSLNKMLSSSNYISRAHQEYLLSASFFAFCILVLHFCITDFVHNH